MTSISSPTVLAPCPRASPEHHRSTSCSPPGHCHHNLASNRVTDMSTTSLTILDQLSTCVGVRIQLGFNLGPDPNLTNSTLGLSVQVRPDRDSTRPATDFVDFNSSPSSSSPCTVAELRNQFEFITQSDPIAIRIPTNSSLGFS